MTRHDPACSSALALLLLLLPVLLAAAGCSDKPAAPDHGMYPYDLVNVLTAAIKAAHGPDGPAVFHDMTHASVRDDPLVIHPPVISQTG